MQRKVILSGELGKTFGREHYFDISTPGEAIRALSANFKEFSKHLIESENRFIYYKVYIDNELMETVDGVALPFSKVIRIVPIMAGSKKGGLGLLLGGLLIAASFFLPGAALFGIAGAPSLASIAFGVGASLVLGGVAQLLSPQPKDEQKKESSYFSGPVNNIRLGQPVPVGYGRLIVGSAVISSGITTDNLTAAGNVLRSDAYARIVDLVSEGEIGGLVTGDERSIYLNKTALKNSDGSSNFSKVSYEERKGTQDQTYLPNFPDVEREFAVNTIVENATPVVRNISDTNVDSVRVTLGVPQLSNIDSKGNPVAAGFTFKIEVQPNGGSYTPVINDAINGRTLSKYQRSYVVPLDGTGPWNIKITRVSADSATQNNVNAFYWDSYTEIIDAKLRYPNSALIGSRIYAEQFSSIPERAFDVYLKLIKVPSNYDPITRAYTGEWDGTFLTKWSNNPAWVFYDLVTNTRYGLGQFIEESQVDKWALYEIAQYCDELVDDGFGGTEPRFTCNLYLQVREEAFKVIQDLASIFRGMVYWSSGLIAAVQDSPADVTAIFTNSNVIEGKFSYQGSSLKTRHSVALVSWNDPSDFYTLKPEYVEDPDAIQRYGIVETEFVALGCTSRGQAVRAGKWLLFSEAYETETVVFKTGIEGASLRPGRVISVHDQDRAAARRGGRIRSATTTEVTVDQAFTPTVGITYTLHVVLPDGSVAESQIDNISGNIVTLATPLSEAPQANAQWLISSSELAPQSFRVINIVEDKSDGTFEVTGLLYNGSKFPTVEQGIILETNNISLINVPPNQVENITVEETLYNYPSGVSTRISLSWDVPDRATSYRVIYRNDKGLFADVTGIKENYLQIDDVEPGDFEFEVYAVNYAGKASIAAAKSQTINGKLTPPADVQNFSLVGTSNGVAQLVWDKSEELDVINGGHVRIRYSPDVDTPSWTNAIDIGEAMPGSATTASVPHVNGAYMAKFIDSGERSSEEEAIVTTTTASLVSLNFIETIQESPSFAGTTDSVTVADDYGGIVLTTSTDIDDYGMVDDVVDWDSEGGFATSGSYSFAEPFDLGAVYTSVLTAEVAAAAFDAATTIDARTDSIDNWPSFDGEGAVDDVNAALYIRTTDDDPTDPDAEWSTYRKFFVGQYAARAFDFKLELTGPGNTHNMAVTGLAVQIDMPDRVEAGKDVASGAGEKTVTFPAPFRATPAIGINAKNMATGDYYQITTPASASGFGITFRNPAGVAVDRTFDYQAKGYGYQQ